MTLPAVDTSKLHRARHAVEEANRRLSENRPEAAVRLLEDALAEGGWTGDVHQVLTHNLVGALRWLAEAHLQRGESDAAGRIAARAMAVPVPPDIPTDMRRHRADFFAALASAFFERRAFGGAVLCQRQAIALYPCPTFQNNLINALAELSALSVLSDYADTLEPGELAPHLLIACQPKSGSTFLKNVLREATGFRDIYLLHAAELSTQELFYPVLLEFADVPTVTHQHCRATEANLQMMQAFGMRAVVLVRHLFDVVVSLSDFYTGGAIRGTRFEVEAWMRLAPERRIDQIIDLVLPWHLEFLASWQQAERDQRLPILWLTYEELMGDKPGAVRRVLEFHGLSIPEAKIAAAIEAVSATPEKNRMNKGVSGRGQANLSEAQKARIRRLVDYFPATDFTRYGIAE